jgi:tRNA pseudouridine55 synthase
MHQYDQMKPLHGWLALDKPLGMSSAFAVTKVRYLLNKIKIGHAGTLDPLASGVLPLALGEATKVCSYLINADKEYEFEITWGESRTTDDAAGTVLQSSTKRPTQEEILRALPAFYGKLEQLPPIYSAKKINGKRAYDLARWGAENIELKPSVIEVKQLTLLNSDEHTAQFHVTCSKGTYVRSLARDLGSTLGCYGYASKIDRTRVGPFTKKSAISLEKLAVSQKIGIVPELIQPLQAVLDDIPAVLIDAQQTQRLRRGQAVVDLDAANQSALSSSDVCICITSFQEPVALAQFVNCELRPKRVFNI